MRVATGWGVLGVLCLGFVASGAEPTVDRSVKPKRKMLEPKEIMQRLEASPLTYRISGMDKLDVARGRLADELWPQRIPPLDYPKAVQRSDGKIDLAPWPETQKARADVEAAEVAFQAKDYAGAAEAYRRALAIDPKYYIVHAYLGDALLFGGDPKAAMVEYDKAIALNGDDYRLYFFRASAHRHLGNRKAMLADLRMSLTLKPRNPVLISAVQRAGPAGGLQVEPDMLVPRAFVRREGKDVAVFVDAERPEWMAWAICKALWVGEASHRKEMTGSQTEHWSTIEEMECLGNLVGVYVSRRESGEGARDDRLDRLEAVIRDGLAFGFVVYELGSRVDPQIALHLDAQARNLVRRYVEKYVLTELSAPRRK